MALETYKGTLVPPTTGTLPVRQDVAPAGLTFQPEVALFFCACTNINDAAQTGLMACVGAALSPTSQFTTAAASDGSGGSSNTGRISRFGTECICLPLNGTPAIDGLAKLVSMNESPFGFSLDWTDLPATANMAVHYFLIGGSDLTDAAIREVTPAGTANGTTQAVDFGFPPDLVLTVSPSLPSTSGVADAAICLGAARRDPTTQQYATFWFENDGAPTMDPAAYSTRSRMGAVPNSLAAKDADYSLLSWDATGISITWDDGISATTKRVYMLALKGGQYELTNVAQPASTGDQVVPTSFPPTGLLLFGTSDTNDTDTTIDTATVASQMSVGGCDSATRQGAVQFTQQDANTNSQAKRRTSATRAAMWTTGTAAAVAAQASVTALGATSYTLNWANADATARKLVGVVFGSTAAGTTPVSATASGAVEAAQGTGALQVAPLEASARSTADARSTVESAAQAAAPAGAAVEAQAGLGATAAADVEAGAVAQATGQAPFEAAGESARAAQSALESATRAEIARQGSTDSAQGAAAIAQSSADAPAAAEAVRQGALEAGGVSQLVAAGQWETAAAAGATGSSPWEAAQDQLVVTHTAASPWDAVAAAELGASSPIDVEGAALAGAPVPWEVGAGAAQTASGVAEWFTGVLGVGGSAWESGAGVAADTAAPWETESTIRWPGHALAGGAGAIGPAAPGHVAPGGAGSIG